MDLVAHDYSIYLNPVVGSGFAENNQFKKPSKPMEGSLDSFKASLKGGHAHVDAQDAFGIYANTLGFESTDLCKKVKVLPFLSGVTSGFYVSRNFNSSLKESINIGYAYSWKKLHKYAVIFEVFDLIKAALSDLVELDY